jgi:uncharacterized protein (TIGR03067 family)
MQVSMFLLVLSVGAPLKDRPTTIYGEWEGVERIINGKSDPTIRTEQFLLKLTEKRWQTSSPKGAIKESTLILDTKANPPTLTLFNKDDKDGTGTPTLTGIYKLEDDKLTICYVQGNGTRPKEFASREGADARLLIFRREKDK